MAVTAVAHDGTPEVFYQASKWHIDEAGGLHIIAPSNKHVGAFAAGKWSYVVENEATINPEDKGITVVDAAEPYTTAVRIARLQNGVAA